MKIDTKSLNLTIIDQIIEDGGQLELIQLVESPTLKQIIEIRAKLAAMKSGTFTGSLKSKSIKREQLPASENVKITVIVPVFNTSKFLAKCLDSILAQTFKEFELICVDDCSTDNSWSILQEYSSRDQRIKIVRHEVNKGLGGARNTAIKLANGKYLASVDSDDYIAPDMLEVLHTTAQKENACIVVCGFQRINENGDKLKPQKQNARVITNQDNCVDIFSTCNPAFWNKLWRTSLFTENNIYFPDHVFYQDLATTPRILTKAKTIAFIESCPYYYLIREGSATYSNSPKHITDYYKVFGLLRKYLHENSLYEVHENGFNTALKRACKFRAENIISDSMPDEDKKQYLSYILSIYNYFRKTAPLTDAYNPNDFLRAIESEVEESPLITLPLSVLVKTICRPVLLRRFLQSLGDYQATWGTRFAEVVVGDDSPLEDQKTNSLVIEQIRAEYPLLNIVYLSFDYDIGCSAGRNQILKASSSRYVMQCDDDFILDAQCDVSAALRQFENKNVDFMGGWLKNRYDTITGEYEYRAAIGTIEIQNESLKITVNEDKYSIPDYADCHFIMNFFLAKRSSLLANPWDNDLKTEEHHEFFVRAYKQGFKVGFSKLLFAKHTYEKPNNSTQYNAHRFEKERWKRYLLLSVQKCGAIHRIIETRKFDRTVIWEVNLKTGSSNERVVQHVARI